MSLIEGSTIFRQASSRRARISRGGFSLVEILTVVAIMSLLAYLTVPSIASLGQSNSVTAAGNEVADLASYAQQYAISHNVMTALVCATSSSASPSSQYRAFTVLARDSSGNWSAATSWLRLSPSAAMTSAAFDSNTFGNYLGNSYSSLMTFAQIFPSLKLDGVAVANGAFQIFYPDGHMDTSAPYVTLRLVSTAHQADTSPVNRYDLIFNPLTGTTTVSRP